MVQGPEVRELMKGQQPACAKTGLRGCGPAAIDRVELIVPDAHDFNELMDDFVVTLDHGSSAPERAIEERSADDAELGVLLEAAFAELVVRYGAEGRSQVKDGARYVVLLDEHGRAVGCGALQVFGPDSEHVGDGELKRMYVLPAARGRGFARTLLAGLEDLARAAGHPVLRLSTGERQPEAIALYESSGYVRTAPWGKYVDQPLTRCYAKELKGAG